MKRVQRMAALCAKGWTYKRVGKAVGITGAGVFTLLRYHGL